MKAPRITNGIDAAMDEAYLPEFTLLTARLYKEQVLLKRRAWDNPTARLGVIRHVIERIKSAVLEGCDELCLRSSELAAYDATSIFAGGGDTFLTRWLTRNQYSYVLHEDCVLIDL